MAHVQTLPPPQYSSLTPHRQEVEYVVLTEADGTAETSLQGYLRILWRHKWFLLLPVICIMPWVCLLVVTKSPSYKAQATVLMEGTDPNVLSIPVVMGPEQGVDFYHTQYEVIKSRAVAEEVVEKLQLYTPQPTKPDSPTMATLKAIKAFPEHVWQAVLASVTPRDREAPASLVGTEASPAETALADRNPQAA